MSVTPASAQLTTGADGLDGRASAVKLDYQNTKCYYCRLDHQKCAFTKSTASCDWCIRNKYQCDLIKSQSPSQRRTLSRYKCEECRKSKQKCLPENRIWPDKCFRCIKKGFPCSKSQSTTHRNPEPLPVERYNVGWICALREEMAAAKAMLDEEHEMIPGLDFQDHISHVLGRVHNHNVVIACLLAGIDGTSSSAIVANKLLATFTALRFCLVLGIGGGIPDLQRGIDIRLGDVVVSNPTTTSGGVIQYDKTKRLDGRQFEQKGVLNVPPPLLLAALAELQADHMIRDSRVPGYLSDMVKRYPKMERMGYAYPGVDKDCLYCNTCHKLISKRSIQACVGTHRVRQSRDTNYPEIHYGLIASGNSVIKNATERDRLRQELGVLCVEMEAAGLIENFPCLVIRGICDYADSHKNDTWLAYAAATAAAFSKELLYYVSPERVNSEKPIRQNPEVSNKHPFSADHYLESLSFDQMNARISTIRTAHMKTCKWLLSSPQYQEWLTADKLSEHHGFLWIKGKPGAGKSTIMKFALASTRRIMQESVVISFFFNARGQELEKSTVGMYRSLIFQLLERLPNLQPLLALLPPTASGDRNSCTWNMKTVQSLFGHVVERMGDQSLICFIDALDECDHDQVREMISFFEHLGQLTALSRLQFRICFSSRHYPHITTEHGVQLLLEDNNGHQNDIVNYVKSELRIGQNKSSDEVAKQLCERASGTFLWLVLVIPILQREFDHGRIYGFRRRLTEIPNGLGALYDDILDRDSQHMDEHILCLQWLLFARRPLRPEELYYGILVGAEPDFATWDHEEMDEQIFGRFVIACSKGLAEVTKTKVKTVQFIHESVRDYLLRGNGFRLFRANRGTDSELFGLSHEKLKKCCQTYMRICVSQLPSLETSLESSTLERTPHLRQRAVERFPFLEYTVRNLLYHADAAEEMGLAQDRFVESFSRGSWAALSNMFERYHVRRYTPNVSSLYIFANENLPNLIAVQLKRDQRMDLKGERYEYPLVAALVQGHDTAANALLEPDIKHWLNSGNDLNELLLTQQYEASVQHVLRHEFRSLDHQKILLWMVENSKTGLIERLLHVQKIDMHVQDTSHGQKLLICAARRGYEKLVLLLLDTGRVDIDCTDQSGRTPLSWAAENGHEAIVRLLLDTGKVDIDCTDQSGRTPLSWAAENGHEAIVRLLLDTVKVYSNCTEQSTPIAVVRGGSYRK